MSTRAARNSKKNHADDNKEDKTDKQANENQVISMNDNYEELIENVLNGLDQSEILKIKRMLNDENDDYNVFKEYIKFLILKAQYIYISMPYTLDLIWHKILLLPSIYVKLCKLIFIKLSIEVNDSNMVIEP